MMLYKADKESVRRITQGDRPRTLAMDVRTERRKVIRDVKPGMEELSSET